MGTPEPEAGAPEVGTTEGVAVVEDEEDPLDRR
jgi:hypothetical protein